MKCTLPGRIRNLLSVAAIHPNAPRPFFPLERLESRTLLSGTVLVSVVRGSLIVRGDTAANVIVIDQAGLNPGQVRITGDIGTGINNQFLPVVLSGITRSADIQMRGGIDSVTIRDTIFPGSLAITDRGSAEILMINNVQVPLNLSIYNNSSTSSSTLINTVIGRDLSIVSNSGGLNATLQAVAVQRNTSIVSNGIAPAAVAIDDSTFAGATRITTGNGADLIQIDSLGAAIGPMTQFNGTFTASLKGGNDTLQFGISGQAGNRTTFNSNVRLDGGAGIDTARNFGTSAFSGTGQILIQHFESFVVIGDVTAPTVNASNPAPAATGIPLNQALTATFSEPMNPLTITSANVSVTGPNLSVVAGTVSYVGTIVTFTPAADLDASTLYTLTITTGAKDLAGNPLAQNFVTTFTTGVTADATAPTVASPVPVNNATGVVLNKKITATFSEPMDPLTIVPGFVHLFAPGLVPVPGTIDYLGDTLTFSPTNPLAPNTLFTLTIDTGVTDLAGNQLAQAFASSFTTGTASDTVLPTITLLNAADLQTNVAINKAVSATFSEPMDSLTITTATFTLKGPGNVAINGTVHYDAASNIASFIPAADLPTNTTFTATINGGAGGVKDLAGNALAANKVWTFTTGTTLVQTPVNMGAAATFAVMATAAISSTGATVINGDVGLNPGTSQGIPTNQVNGNIHVDDQPIIDAQAALLTAYGDATSRATNAISLPGLIGGLTFTPGLYTNGSSVSMDGDVTLDAQGDPNAIFIFQMGSTLITSPGAHVILAGGAKANNIFWQVGSSATLDTTTIFKGNILAAVTITVNNGSAIEGRLLAGSTTGGSVTINASTVTVPIA